MTRMGELAFAVPQVRDSSFYPSALDKGSRTEQALHLALAEMCVRGVSTRKAIAVPQSLLGPEVPISSAQVSRAAGQIVDCAVLVAAGVTADGKRRVLGVSAELSEAEAHWRGFLEGLARRGLCGVGLIVADGHAGLKAARRAVRPGVPWQRCQFHLRQNAQATVTRLDQSQPVAQRIRALFNAPGRDEAQRLPNQAIELWRKEAHKLAGWAQENLAEGFAVFGFPPSHRVRPRTTNGLERINRELKRRTRAASIFPNPPSCLRLVSALLAECDEEWMTGKIYPTMKA